MAGNCGLLRLTYRRRTHTLEPNYADNFKVANEQSRENIFTIVTDKTLYPTLFKNLFRSRHYAQGGAQHGVGENGRLTPRGYLGHLRLRD